MQVQSVEADQGGPLMDCAGNAAGVILHPNSARGTPPDMTDGPWVAATNLGKASEYMREQDSSLADVQLAPGIEEFHSDYSCNTGIDSDL